MNPHSSLRLALTLAVSVVGPARAQSAASLQRVVLAGRPVGAPLTPLQLAAREFDDTGHARVIPPANPGDFTTFPFGFSQPFLRCGALKLCQVELEPGETLTDEPLLGDRERWDVDQTSSGNVAVVVVKPKECDVRTNLLIVTDRRRYVVDLEAAPCRGTNPAGDYMPGIRFWYPGEERRAPGPRDALRGMLVDVRALNTGYRWQTSRRISWNPVRIFDDGVRTIVQFSPAAQNGEMPVLYGVADDGTREQVNAVLRPDPSGDYLVTDRVLKRGVLVLRDGKRERKLALENVSVLRRER
jgi:type IV secretion system protein VirB9